MRQLKHHEKKLLKKVDFLSWKTDSNAREAQIMRRYLVQRREDYHEYNKLCGQARRLSHLLSKLPSEDPFRAKYEAMLMSKLYDIGIVGKNATLGDLEGSDKNAADRPGKVTVAAFCRRRLAVVMVRLKMAETMKTAVTYIEQGHVRVGPDTITDPAFLVTRYMEDFVTWVDTSKLKRHVQEYNNELDDYDLL